MIENLTENGIKALNKIIMAQKETDVLNILNEFAIDNLEGEILLYIFHQADAFAAGQI